MARLIDGKSVADRIRARVAADVSALGFQPGLAAVLVGDDPASHLYVSLKEKACAEVGIRFEKTFLPTDATESDVIAAVQALSARTDVHGIIVQMPLPPQVDADRVIAALDPAKDADGFHPVNVAAFKKGSPRVVPALPAAIMALMAETGVPLDGALVLVVGNSQTFFEPVKAAFSQVGALAAFTVPTAPDLAVRTKKAEVIVTAVGRPGLITGAMLSPGAVVIDAGTGRTDDGRTVGDADPATVDGVAAWRSPVPGGVGPVTVAMLLANVAALAEQQADRTN